jgi:anti-anti-sigma regulatory factor
MSQKFQSSVQQRGDAGYIKLSGVIDEDNELADLTDKVRGKMIVIELGEVERINSCGVRDWVNWLSTLEGRGSEIVLVKCSPAIVAQINLVNNFTRNGSVQSFFVPYFCPECDEEKVLLSETNEMGPPPIEPPVCRCDGCDLVMDFDDMADSYFAFLGSHKKVNQSAKVQSVLDTVSKDVGGASAIRARVSTGGGATGGGSTGGGLGSVSQSSLPSVPSLPSIGIGGGGSGVGAEVGSRVGSNVGSRPGAVPPQDFSDPPPGAGSSAEMDRLPPRAPKQRSNALVYVLAVVLLGALGVLGFLLMNK